MHAERFITYFVGQQWEELIWTFLIKHPGKLIVRNKTNTKTIRCDVTQSVSKRKFSYDGSQKSWHGSSTMGLKLDVAHAAIVCRWRCNISYRVNQNSTHFTRFGSKLLTSRELAELNSGIKSYYMKICFTLKVFWIKNITKQSDQVPACSLSDKFRNLYQWRAKNIHLKNLHCSELTELKTTGVK